MTAEVKLYLSTGFDLLNIPDSPALLQGSEVITLPFVYVKQTGGMTAIKCEVKYEQVTRADYCQIGDFYYFIIGLHMLNNNVCLFTLEEDVYTTLGGTAGFEIIDGWCTRRCVTDDTPLKYTLPEDFSPSQPLTVTEYYMPVQESLGRTTIVASTVDLTDEDFTTADIYGGTPIDGDVTADKVLVAVPSTPDLTSSTTVQIKSEIPDNLKTISFILPKIGLYDMSNPTVSKNVKKCRSLGIESVIVGCYNVPTELITNTTGENFISFIENTITEKNFKTRAYGDKEGFPLIYMWQPNIKNNKAFSEFNDLMIYNPSSGANTVYSLRDLHDSELNINLNFYTFGILSPDGSSYIAPAAYMGNEIDINNIFSNSMKGGNWQNVPIVYGEASGQMINDANYNKMLSDWNRMRSELEDRYNKSTIRNNIDTFLGGGLNAASRALEGDTRGAITGGIRDLYTGVNRAIDIQDQYMYDMGRMVSDIKSKALSYELGKNVVVPEIQFSYSINEQAIYGDVFRAKAIRLSEDDIKRFDEYLTMYGYRVSEPLTKECFTGRDNFNFVKAQGVTVDSKHKYANRSRRIALAENLSNGIRVWHVKPTQEALKNNPITTTEQEVNR